MAESEGALSKLLEVLISSEHRLSKRAALMVVLAVGVWICDNHLGFSAYYGYGHKVDQVSKIEALLEKSNLDSTVRKQLQALERQILNRRSLADHLPSLMSLINRQRFLRLSSHKKQTLLVT